jgi:capsular polysaccharide biosynthesis protein
MAVFERASVVIGPHGGSFVNLIYCKPGTGVVEFNSLLSPDPPRLYYAAMSYTLQLVYYSVEPTVFDGYQGAGMDVDTEAATAALLQALEEQRHTDRG